MKTIAAIAIAIVLAPCPVLANAWDNPDMPVSDGGYDPLIDGQNNAPSGPSGGVYVESGNIGNWYGRDGSHCVTTNMNGIVNMSCY